MRVTVTGANGLVGSRLCRWLVVEGHIVTALARRQRRFITEVARKWARMASRALAAEA